MNPCKTCAFWIAPEVIETEKVTDYGYEKVNSSADKGECRFNPPMPLGNQVEIERNPLSLTPFTSVWPKTKPDDWCGRWRSAT